MATSFWVAWVDVFHHLRKHLGGIEHHDSPLQQFDGILQRFHQNLLVVIWVPSSSSVLWGNFLNFFILSRLLVCALGSLLVLLFVALRSFEVLFSSGDQLNLLRQQLSPGILGVSDASSDPLDGKDHLFLVIVVTSLMSSLNFVAPLDFDSEVKVFPASMAASISSLKSLALASLRSSCKYQALITAISLIFIM